MIRTAILYRRHWLGIRPWLKDAGVCVAFVCAIVATMSFLEHLPQAYDALVAWWG